jgi:single-strand DNA-binding protein
VAAPLHCQLRNNRLAIFNNRNAKQQSTNFKIMYALKNKVQLIGNLGNAPEVRNTETGKKLARFSMATNEQYKNSKGERVTETQWHNVIAWGNVAEIAEKYLKKGAEVAVEGKLVNRSYVDKEGAKRTITEIQVTEILMLSKATAPMVA